MREYIRKYMSFAPLFLIILTLFVTLFFFLAGDYQIEKKIIILNNKSIESVTGKKVYHIIEKDKADSVLKNLSDAIFKTLLFASEQGAIENIQTNAFILSYDSSDIKAIPSHLINYNENEIIIKSHLGYIIIPSDKYAVVKRYSDEDTQSSLIFLTIIMAASFLGIFITYYFQSRISNLYNSFSYYKKWRIVTVYFNGIMTIFIVILLVFQTSVYLLSTSNEMDSFDKLLNLYPFYNHAFVYSSLLLFFFAAFFFSNPINILNRVITYMIMKKNVDQYYDSDEINLGQHLVLKEISNLMQNNENRLDFFLVKSGFSLNSHMKRLNIQRSIKLSPKNIEIISSLQGLYSAGFIDFDENQISLSILGKEKAELPSLLFINSVPPKYDYAISKAYRSFIEMKNEEAIKICSTDILESFTKWAITKLETNQDQLDLIITKVLGKNKTLEDAALGRLISVFKEVTMKYKQGKEEELSKINHIIEACIHIIEVAKSIRNDYSHERDSLLFTTPKVTEDTYNLINLSRAFVSSVCRYLVP